ncbi:F-box protein [Hirschfeldia incana]|nr:F-box protein [Hirschfeldia incana]
MKISCEELGGSQKGKSEWGFGNLAKDDFDFLDTMSFYDYQMIYDTVSSSVNDLLGFGNDTKLPDDPFSMNIRSTLNSISDWWLVHESQFGLVSQQSHDEPMVLDQNLLQQQKVSSLDIYYGFEGLCEEAATLPEDPFCMKPRSIVRDLVTDPDDDGDGGEEEPHPAFDIVLPYLEMRDLLAVEGVCRSLRDSVRKESSFLWRTIDLSGDSPLKHRVTDESLLKLTRRAQGHLQCLNLGGCVSITDNGLMQVLATNPHLSKLSVSGCHRLTTVGVLSILRDLKSSNQLGVKTLITGGALYFTKEQFKELNLLLLGADAKAPSRRRRLYTSCRSEFSIEDDGGTDLEICPWCEKPSLVFDCASETCQLKDHPCPKQSCRACVVCIERCHDCGSCLSDCEHKPFCFAFSCVICYKKRSNQLQELV